MSIGIRSLHYLLITSIIATTLLTPLVLAENTREWQQYHASKTASNKNPSESPNHLPYTLAIRQQCAMWKQGDNTSSTANIFQDWADQTNELNFRAPAERHFQSIFIDNSVPSQIFHYAIPWSHAPPVID